MPIPMTDMQPTIQQPRRSGYTGQSLDLSPRVEQAFKASMQTVDLMSKASESVAGVAMQYQEIDDWNKSNDAVSSYHRKMSELNSYRNSLKGTNAQNFEKEYEMKANQYHSEFVAAIGAIKNSKIREDARTKINGFNIDNAAHSFMFFDTVRKEVATESNNAAIDAISNEMISNVSVYSPNNIKNFTERMDEVESKYYANAALVGETAEATAVKVAAKKAEIASQVARKLDQDSYGIGATQPYAASLQFLRSIRGQNPYEVAQKEITDRLKEQIALDAVRHPEIFLKDDKFNPVTRKKYAPELNQYEYEMLLKNVEENKKKNASAPAEAISCAASFVDKRLQQSKKWDEEHGYFSDKEAEKILSDSGYSKERDKDLIEEWKNEQADKRRKTKTYEIMNEIQALKELQSREVWYDTVIKDINEQVTDQEALSNPKRFYKFFPGNVEAVRNRIKELESRVDSKLINFETWQKNPTLTQGVTYTLEEVVHLKTLGVLKKYADAKGVGIDYISYRDAMPFIISSLNGGFVSQDGNEKGRRMYYWNDKNTNYDQFHDLIKMKGDIDLAIYFGLNKAVGHSMLKDMYQTVKNTEGAPDYFNSQSPERNRHFNQNSRLDDFFINIGQREMQKTGMKFL